MKSARIAPFLWQIAGVRDHGYKQSPLGGDGNPQVDALLQQDLVLTPRGVEERVIKQRLRNGVRHERQIGEVDTVTIAEGIAL